jgi:hypothetical protein
MLTEKQFWAMMIELKEQTREMLEMNKHLIIIEHLLKERGE